MRNALVNSRFACILVLLTLIAFWKFFRFWAVGVFRRDQKVKSWPSNS